MDYFFALFFTYKIQITKVETKVNDDNIQITQEHRDSSSPVVGINTRTKVNQSTSQETQSIRATVCQIFKDNCQQAIRVFECESGLRSTAISRTGDYGVTQINLRSHASKIPVEDKVSYLFNPDNNIRLAHSIWQNQGWRPWYSSEHCWGNN